MYAKLWVLNGTKNIGCIEGEPRRVGEKRTVGTKSEGLRRKPGSLGGKYRRGKTVARGQGDRVSIPSKKRRRGGGEQMGDVEGE